MFQLETLSDKLTSSETLPPLLPPEVIKPFVSLKHSVKMKIFKQENH